MTTTTPASTCECLTPLCVWESGERKRKDHRGHGDHRGQKLPPCSSRQQTPPRLPGVNPVGHRWHCPLLAGAPLQAGRWPGSPEGPSPTPRHHTRQDRLEVPAAPRPHLPGGNQGKTHQSHGTTRPSTARSTAASPGSSRAVTAPPSPHRHGTGTPRNPPPPPGPPSPSRRPGDRPQRTEPAPHPQRCPQ